MGFFDKLVDKFIEVKREEPDKFKFKMPKRVNFDKFYTDYNKIVKQIKVINDKLAKENNKLLRLPDMEVLYDNEMETTIYNQQQIMKYSNSEKFSIGMAQLIRFLRTYALYFVNEYDSLDDKERAKIVKSLFNLYDNTIFNVLRYYVFQQQKKLVWDMKENAFHGCKGMNSDILKMVIKILDSNTHLCNAILLCNKEAARNVMHKELLNIENVYAQVVTDDCDEIFEL